MSVRGPVAEAAAGSAPGAVLLRADREEVLALLERCWGAEVDDLQTALREALDLGSATAAFEYVAAVRRLVQKWLAVLRTARLVEEPVEVAYMVLTTAAPQLPFSARFGGDPATAAVLELVERLRELVPGARPLAPDPARLPDIDIERMIRFLTLTAAELAGAEESRVMLIVIRNRLQLTLTELGELFGISRQAATRWFEDGLPQARLAKANVVLEVVDQLSRRLKPGRLPAVARRPAADYGGRTMLEMIRDDRHQELLDSVRGSFDWSVTA